MKRIILLLLSLLLVLLFSGCRGDSGAKLPEKNPVFRNVNWGMTPEEVRAIETATFDRSEGGVVGDDTQLFFKLKLFDEHPCTLVYLFDRGKRLIRATYWLKDLANVLETGKEIRGLLEEKYGMPDVGADYSSTFMFWETDRSTIDLKLSFDYESVDFTSLFIRYTEKESPAQRKEREKNKKEREKNKEEL